MTAGNYNFPYDSGADVVAVLTWNNPDGSPVDLTGYSAALTYKAKNGPAVTLTDTDGLTLGGSSGTISLDITGDTTATWQSSVSYDLFVTAPNGVITKLLYGNFVRAS